MDNSTLNYLLTGVYLFSMASLWVPLKIARPIFGNFQVQFWHLPFAVTILLGMYLGALNFIALFGILVYLALTLLKQRFNKPLWLNIVLIVLFTIFSLALGFHLIPGFERITLAENIFFGASQVPHSIGFQIDKNLIGLFILGFLISRIESWSDWKITILKALPVFIGTAVISFSLALALNYINLDIKIPQYLLLWALFNLLFTCVTEEAFFRGFIQQGISNSLSKFKAGPYIAIFIAGTLFGLAHFGGGMIYVVLASIAGIGYGLAFHITKRIEAAILVHFLLNFSHIILFTYPSLPPA